MARKQKPLPGCEELFIAELDDVAASYESVKVKRCKLTKEETETKTLLIQKMIEHGQTRYKTSDDLIIDLLDKKNIKVHKASENGDGEGAEE